MSTNAIVNGQVNARHFVATDWMDYSLEIDEFISGPIAPRFIDGVVATGHCDDDEFRCVEFSIGVTEPYL